MGRIGNLVTASVAVVVLALSATGVAVSAPTNDAGIKSACVEAGLLKPRNLKPRFWLQIYEYQVGPSGYVPFFLRSMPEDCVGRYSRSLSIHLRYKTTLHGWRTYHGVSDEHLTTWTRLWNENKGTEVTLGPELIDEESSRSPWGDLVKVVAQAKLLVKDVYTKRIVGRKLYRVPVIFARSPRREPLR